MGRDMDWRERCRKVETLLQQAEIRTKMQTIKIEQMESDIAVAMGIVQTLRTENAAFRKASEELVEATQALVLGDDKPESTRARWDDVHGKLAEVRKGVSCGNMHVLGERCELCGVMEGGPEDG